MGELIPPCGVPTSVGNSVQFSMRPAFSHRFSTSLSVGMWSSIHARLMLWEQPEMSPSSTHGALSLRDSTRNLNAAVFQRCQCAEA